MFYFQSAGGKRRGSVLAVSGCVLGGGTWVMDQGALPVHRKKDAVCNTCTLKLVTIAYQRVPAFRLMREPLKLGMRFLSWYYRVNPDEYAVRTPHCYGCIRFHKTALKEKSALFRWLNDRVNPIFDDVLKQIVTEEEVKRAKSYARAATGGEVKPEEASEWMRGQRTGL
jgi:hypothetical protein